MRNFIIREWSDTRLTFTLYQTECWNQTIIDPRDYDSFVLNITFSDWENIELTWTINENGELIFDLESSITVWKSWNAKMELWWLEWWSKIRFNESAINCTITQSLNVPNTNNGL